MNKKSVVMTHLILLFYAFLFCTSCAEKKKTENLVDNHLWTIDVTKEYPTKDIYLQDIADVDYIPLETNDSILWVGREIVYMDEDYIIGANRNTGIYFHDKTGKALRAFHKRGQGPEEYTTFSSIQYDKESDEIYLVDHLQDERYYIYDSKGNFKRTFQANDFYSRIIDGKHIMKSISEFFILNAEELIQYQKHRNCYTRVSRQTGKHLGDIELPGKDSTLTLIYRRESDGMLFSTIAPHSIKDENGYILTAFPSDTTYLLTKDLQIRPIGIRTPPINTMEVPIFLFPARSTTRYYFMYTVKKEDRFPRKLYMLDKKENQIYHLDNYFKNRDFKDKEHALDFYGPASEANLPSNVCVESLNIDRLIEAYQEGKLSGKLKDIAANLKEDDNPVLMVVKFKE